MPMQDKPYYGRRDEHCNKRSCKVSHKIQRVGRSTDLQDTLQPLIDACKNGYTRENTQHHLHRQCSVGMRPAVVVGYSSCQTSHHHHMHQLIHIRQRRQILPAERIGSKRGVQDHCDTESRRPISQEKQFQNFIIFSMRR